MRKLIIPFLFLLISSSCTTDFDITGDWQEITVVYGLMNQNNDTTFLKINKAFLGEDNALTMANIPDSSSYFNDLEVSVQEWKVSPAGDINGTRLYILKTITFDTTTFYKKEPGQFYSGNQILYKAYTKEMLSADNIYILKIRNKKSGKEISGRTILVGDYSITQPMNTIDFTKPTQPAGVKWKTGKNGRRYEVTIRFNYKELPSGQTDTLYKHFDWLVNTMKSDELTGGKVLETSYSKKYFYTLVEKNLTKDPGIKRFAGKVEFIVACAADEFSTYLDVATPSNSIVQDKPEYTNITNGIGIFSSRYEKVKSCKLLSTTVDTLKLLGYGF